MISMINHLLSGLLMNFPMLTNDVITEWIHQLSSVHCWFVSLFRPSAACGRGFYKSSSQDLQCSRCPAHSFNDREGSWRCDCEDGYYRAPSDPPSVACTRKSDRAVARQTRRGSLKQEDTAADSLSVVSPRCPRLPARHCNYVCRPRFCFPS